ncbi:multidrug effflux MFS transporter [Azospirillum oryzae]|uniref:Bcr/CflA family efflux transporter n=1 Tax=Azospirillum oryzae TaxID=286727 RepID=A0A6N1AYA7_9PROT|nr:multidrug effflux MFS transporter [Azospirillum oryzae]KAA0591480.1 multidrug effflux MFS transporter [Azospirillum oryzae]QKS52772.1 multidrug effflux MFS transporter [Azospirillum oryzae]GLR80427.1 Bcr/CflA family drug resistance efflux transporter [Azospirillum oryzae]
MPRPDSLSIRVLLTALVAFGPLSTDLYLPSLPTLVRVFDTDVATVQLTLSIFLVGFAVSQLVYGPMSDRFGRRPTLLVGVTIYLAASAVCAMTSSIDALIAARFFQALGACCGPVVARAVVRDVFGRDRAATVLAYMSMAMALAPAVGPMLGGVLTEWFGWRANFMLLTLFACGILAAVWSMLGETNAHRDEEALRPGRLAANYLMLMRNRGFVGYVLVVAFSYSGIFSFISGSSFVLIGQLHLTPAEYGASFGAVVLGYMLGTFLAGRLTPRLGGARMIRIGTLLSLGGGLVGGVLALAGVLHLLAIVVPVFLFILGAGLTLPNASANAVGPYPTMAGLASSLLGFAQMAIAAVVGIVVGHLNDGTALPMMGAIGLVGLGALLAHRLLVIPAARGGRSA